MSRRTLPPLLPYATYPERHAGCQPALQLTEEDVRRIVREELANEASKAAARHEGSEERAGLCRGRPVAR